MNLRDLNNLKKKFCSDLDSFSDLELNLKTKSKLEFVSMDGLCLNSFDLSLIDSNFYEEKIREKVKSIKIIEISSDLNLNISGIGVLYLIVKNDCILNLNFISSNLCFAFPFIKIFVEDGVKLNLIEFISFKNLYKNIEIILGRDSKVKFASFFISCLMSDNKIYLNLNSSSDLKAAYFADGVDMKLFSSSIHLDAKSSSDMIINGAIINSAKLVNDGKVFIGENAFKSNGFQRMENIILDKTSKILSEPVLEIKNNDVKCSHGSSISELSLDLLFYMNSRNISKEKAISLFVKGFFDRTLVNVDSTVVMGDILKKLDFIL